MLPRIEELQLRRFSIYARRTEIDIEYAAGVTCFAGANGIGKSTLLALTLYGLTGAVPTPERGFKDLKDYRYQATAEARSYFDGRVAEKDRAAARVRLQFRCGETRCVVERKFFDLNSIVSLEINGRQVRDDRMSRFESTVIAAAGVKTFDQFVFLMHFLSVFDEARHLLFWDNRALEQILFVVFGDEELASSAESARRSMEKADSRARNLQFESKKVQDRLKILVDAQRVRPQAGNSDAALLRYETAQAERSDALHDVETRSDEISSCNISLAEKAAAVAALRDDYSSIFKSSLRGAVPLADHPSCKAIVARDPCPICSSVNTSRRQRAVKAIAADVCPLCDTSYVDHSANNLLTKLETIDNRIKEADEALSNETARLKRLSAEREDARQRLLAVERELLKIEREHPDVAFDIEIVRTTGHKRAGATTAIAALELNIQEIQSDKQKALVQRERYREELVELQQRLAERYAILERDFVPTLQALAKRFLGLDVSVRLRILRGARVALQLDVDGARRELSTKLSESQRFFVDIALRMALVSFLSQGNGAELYIDTPEGSLDIAYESRAGEMFAEFVEAGNDLVITANINTSALLRRLADRCRAALMVLIPMTRWSNLSEVQQKEQPAFDAAFESLQALLAR